ncbi:MAG: hypothetical protein HMLKMBBP_00290 [Planctomycetes bacterium]|nr:hypothetical protein [Planctomycetota bacterium]
MNARTLAAAALPALLLPVPPASGGERRPHAPPTPVFEARDAAEPRPPFRADPVLYSHGDPTDEEQLFMEIMNRARADPDAEADRVFDDYGLQSVTSAVNFYTSQRPGVEYTRAENRDAFRSYAPQPPFAFNANLLAAARAHSELMKERDTQSHQVSGEPALGARITSAGYVWSSIGESVFSYADNMLDGHAGFAVDWGQAVPMGDTRPALGHRDSLMNFSGTRPFVEAGVGVVADTSPATDVGPRLLTIDFAVPAAANRFVTGICWQDQDGDGFYDPGEGIPGARIESPQSSFYTESSASGGYALPFPSNAGAITVTVSGTDGQPSEAIGVQTFNLSMTGSNVKLDVSVPPDPAVPDFVEFSAGGPFTLDGAMHEFTVNVPDFEGMDAITAVELDASIADPDMASLAAALVSPQGTIVDLHAASASALPLAGVFPRTVSSAEPFRAFDGEDGRGVWTLRITRTAGASDGTVARFVLRLRPDWPRSLAADPSNLDVTSLTWTAGAAGLGSLKINANVDAGGATLDPGAPVVVSVLPEVGDEVLVTFLAGNPATTGKIAYGIRGTSKATVKLKFTGLDLPAAPGGVTVVLRIGGARVMERIPLAGGKYRAAAAQPTDGLFAVSSVKSTVAGAVRTTVVKGKLLGAPAPSGIVEAVLGTENGAIPATALMAKGTKFVGKSSGRLAKVTWDTASGAFTVKFVGAASHVGGDGLVRFGLRIGDAYFEDVVRPGASGGY